jgi:uncharacterized membrane protein YdjX (TVP38/TMEM64 family)
MSSLALFVKKARSSKPKSSEQLRRIAPWAGFGLVLLVLCIGWVLLPVREWMDGIQHWLLGLGFWGVAIFTLILIVATFLPLPDWPLPIVAGYVYGVWAFVLVYIGIVMPSMVAFLAARHLARDPIKAFLASRPKFRAIDKVVAREGWKVVVLLRLSPVVPFNLQNYALGVTGISFCQYVGATLAGVIPGIAIYVYFGIFGKGLGSGASFIDWVIFVVGCLATIALGMVVTHQTKAKFAEKSRSQQSSPNRRR